MELLVDGLLLFNYILSESLLSNLLIHHQTLLPQRKLKAVHHSPLFLVQIFQLLISVSPLHLINWGLKFEERGLQVKGFLLHWGDVMHTFPFCPSDRTQFLDFINNKFVA